MSPIREVSCSIITETVKRLFTEANLSLGEDVLSAVERACGVEESERGRFALEQISENARIAREEQTALCQDTGLAVVFAEIGQDVHIAGGSFHEAVQEGVRRAYGEGFFRKSLCDPLTRKNTGDNTPAVIHSEIVSGDRILIRVMAKGGGSENMSTLRMLLPTAGAEGIKKTVVESVERAGPNPCPPVIIGVGIGGTMERACLLSKKALLRPLGERSGEDRLAQMEGDLLEEVNRLGIGPQGYGGRTTALAVHIEMEPCHIASLPVAVNIQCHSARHKEAII
jgi:fumarate hydratase subunit alpha